jgi:ABC-2 type transport system ATP-binding protein
MSDNTAINVSHVSKTFKLPHEKNSSLKSALINFGKHKKGFERQEVLSDVSFKIEKGDFFAIVGRNGSGKSTMLKLLADIYTPSEGNITVYGKLTPFIELGVGFNQELSGRENVFLNGALLGFSRSDMRELYDDIVEFAELEKFMDQKLKNYSSGMQVRLAFAIAIRAETDILLLDEVLAVGDARFQQKCYDYFEELKAQKKTVVFVSHDMSAIRRFCNKAVYIDKGVMTHQGTPEEIADVYLEENMQIVPKTNASDETNKVVQRHKVQATINDRQKNALSIDITYSSKDSFEMYVGISISKDGISIAEINTLARKPLLSNGVVSYALDTSILNGGSYRVGVALFKSVNKELIAVSKTKNQFVVKHSDNTRGGSLRLDDTWKI